MDLQSKIILISGPTASGKSKFAINLAKKINAEIINADSMQVYKELKILTARPNLKEQKKILLNIPEAIDISKQQKYGPFFPKIQILQLELHFQSVIEKFFHEIQHSDY